MSRGEDGREPDAAVPERLKELDSALVMIAHELRTPLTVMKGWADTLTSAARAMDQEALIHGAEAISRNATRMDKILQNMSDAKAIDEGQLDLEMKESLVSELVGEVSDDLEQIGERHRIEIKIDDDALLLIDTGRVRQILLNLITNALKFSPPETSVFVKVARENQFVTICVSDRGAGIEPGRYQELFQKFSRLGAKEKGTGLGLYISREIARAMGGDLVLLEDASNTGCDFALSLPTHGERSEATLSERDQKQPR